MPCFPTKWGAECYQVNDLQPLFSHPITEEPVTPQSPSNDSMPSYCRNEEGDIFLAAESWKPNMCSSCVCLDGTISCFSETCPPVACARPVLRKGQCCPYCLGM